MNRHFYLILGLGTALGAIYAKNDGKGSAKAAVKNSEPDPAAAQTDPANPIDDSSETQGDEGGPAIVAGDTAKTTKSIVPVKYAGKYKDGGSDPLSMFIKQECVGKDGFEFTAFFKLCRDNGIAEDKVKVYEDAVAAKKQGANGRARMTLRNMLATFARKNGKLKKLDGTEQNVAVAKPAVSGAAATASTASAEAGTATT